MLKNSWVCFWKLCILVLMLSFVLIFALFVHFYSLFIMNLGNKNRGMFRTDPFCTQAPADFYPTLPDFWRPVRQEKWVRGACLLFSFFGAGLGELAFSVSETFTCPALYVHKSDKKLTRYKFNVDWMHPNKSFYNENPKIVPKTIAARLRAAAISYP